MNLTKPGAEFLFSSRLRGWLWGLLLVIAAVVAYQPVWHAGFVWDDNSILLDNPLIPKADGWYQAWFNRVSEDFVPVTITSFWLEWRLWGANPLGYHLDNVLLHLCSALLLWRILLRLKIPGAWLAAALFAVHPVNVESVAWITQRKNTLTMLIFLAAVQFYLTFEDSGRRRWLWLAAGMFLLALLGKTAVVPLPVVLLGLAWWRRGRVDRKDLQHSLIFFALAAAGSFMAIWIQHGTGIGTVVRAESFWARLARAGLALWFYLGKVLLPLNLNFVYPRWEIPAGKPLSYLPLVLWAAGLWMCWRYRKGWGKGALLALGYFSVMLLPVLGFVNIFFMLYSPVSDHWQYFAMIGPLALAAAGFQAGLAALTGVNKWLTGICCATLLAGLGALTWKQCGMYADIETLWRTTIDRNPDCWLAQNDLGAILYEKGQVDQAIVLFRRSLAIQPDNAEARNNLGAALDKKGQLDEAILQFQKAVAIRPYFAEAHRNLGDTLLRKGQVDQAIIQFQEAVAIRPDFAKAHRNLAETLLGKGQVDQAILQFQEALELHPDEDNAHYNLGIALLQKGQRDQAMIQFQKEAAIRPDNAEAQNNLGYCLLQKGRMDEAVAHLRKALELHPDYAQAHFNLGNALLQKGRVDEAIIEFQKLLAIQPGLAEAHNCLGNALLRKARVNEAILELQKALAIQPGFAEARRTLAGIAWRLATSPNPSLRNGTKAIELARQTDQLARGSDPMMAATLAAACAEAGQFNQAAAAARRALQLAARQDNAAMVAAIQEQLNCYEAGSPFRDMAAPP
jgi:tetratricopeptide (TPR) repeat protein